MCGMRGAARERRKVAGMAVQCAVKLYRKEGVSRLVGGERDSYGGIVQTQT